MLHPWEEPCLARGNSGAVFFSGCSLRCVYCQNSEISRDASRGEEYTPERLAGVFRELERRGAENIDLVTPTHFAGEVAEALRLYRPRVPVVYNSSGYEKPETLRLLEGLADVWLMDFKYSDPALAAKYSAAPDYPDVAKAALLECSRQKPAPVYEGGMLRSGIVVRHLLLPGATENAISALEWVRRNVPGAVLSLLRQYTPHGENLPAELRRRVTGREYDKVVNRLIELGVEDCYLQEPGCADESFIPRWD